MAQLTRTRSTHYAHATVHTGPLTTLLHWSEGRAHRMHAARGTHARRRLLRQVRTRSIDHEAYAFTATPSRHALVREASCLSGDLSPRHASRLSDDLLRRSCRYAERPSHTREGGVWRLNNSGGVWRRVAVTPSRGRSVRGSSSRYSLAETLPGCRPHQRTGLRVTRAERPTCAIRRWMRGG